MPSTAPPYALRRLLRRPGPWSLVVVGGAGGAAAREAIEQAVPSASGGLPVGTLAVNLIGALLLGALLEAVVRAGDDAAWHRRVRLLVGTGFMGAFTTYSTFAVETVQLGRSGHVAVAVAYAALTVIGGLVATGAGVLLAAGAHRRAVERLPVDPDVDPERAAGRR